MAREKMDLFRAVLFDLDDTLNDRARSVRMFVNGVFVDALGGSLSVCSKEEVFRAFVEADQSGYRPREAFVDELCERLPWRAGAPKEELNELWRVYFPACAVAREGAIDLLRELRSRGVKLGIVTNGGVAMQQAKIDSMGLRQWVDAVVISEGVDTKKPEPDIFNHALSLLGVPAGEALFVGDHAKNDIWGAMQVGMRAAWIPIGRSWPVDLTEADYRIERLVDLRKILGLCRSAGRACEIMTASRRLSYVG